MMVLSITSIMIAQTDLAPYKNGVRLTDSLYYGTPGDSLKSYNLKSEYVFWKIFLDGNTSVPADSLKIREGIFVFNATGSTVVDTTWGSWVTLKDSSFTSVSVAVNTSDGESYLLLNPNPELLQISLLNHRGTLDTRKVRFSLKSYNELYKTSR